MARSNYSYAKRLKEIARQKKQEEKRQRKLSKTEPVAAAEGESQAAGEQNHTGSMPEGAKSGDQAQSKPEA